MLLSVDHGNYAINTPDTAYDWNTKGNWQNEVVGASGDDVNIWVNSSPSELRLQM